MDVRTPGVGSLRAVLAPDEQLMDVDGAGGRKLVGTPDLVVGHPELQGRLSTEEVVAEERGADHRDRRGLQSTQVQVLVCSIVVRKQCQARVNQVRIVEQSRALLSRRGNALEGLGGDEDLVHRGERRTLRLPILVQPLLNRLSLDSCTHLTPKSWWRHPFDAPLSYAFPEKVSIMRKGIHYGFKCLHPKRRRKRREERGVSRGGAGDGCCARGENRDAKIVSFLQR